ncbi:hypothetical protein YPPY90_1870, partial [Yersinia pestis PY-90]
MLVLRSIPIIRLPPALC